MKSIKSIIILLFLFSFMFGFGQTKNRNSYDGNSYEEIECNRFINTIEERNLILKKDAKNINFDKIHNVIFQEILKNKFSKDSLKIFIQVCRNGCDFPCILNQKKLYPIYNEYEFWSPENIARLSNKLNKTVDLSIVNSVKYQKIKEDNENTLCLDFSYKRGKILVVKYIFDNYKIVYYKTYQYQNKRWVEILTIDEYKS